MISLINLIETINQTIPEPYFKMYIKGGVCLTKLLMNMTMLNSEDFIKACEEIKVKKLYPVDNDIFVELDGVKICDNYDCIAVEYECLKEKKKEINMIKDYNVVTVNLDNDLYDNVNDLAYHRRMTRSDLIREALQTYLKKEVEFMTVNDIYNITLSNVVIRRGSVNGTTLYTEESLCDGATDLLHKYGNRRVSSLAIDGDKLVIAVEK